MLGATKTAMFILRIPFFETKRTVNVNVYVCMYGWPAEWERARRQECKRRARLETSKSTRDSQKQVLAPSSITILACLPSISCSSSDNRLNTAV